MCSTIIHSCWLCAIASSPYAAAKFGLRECVLCQLYRMCSTIIRSCWLYAIASSLYAAAKFGLRECVLCQLHRTCSTKMRNRWLYAIASSPYSPYAAVRFGLRECVLCQLFKKCCMSTLQNVFYNDVYIIAQLRLPCIILPKKLAYENVFYITCIECVLL